MLERVRAKMPVMNDGHAQVRSQMWTVKLRQVRERGTDVREGDDASSACSPTLFMNQDSTCANNRTEDELRYQGPMMPGGVIGTELVECGLDLVIGVEPAAAVGSRSLMCRGLSALCGCHGVGDALPALFLT